MKYFATAALLFVMTTCAALSQSASDINQMARFAGEFNELMQRSLSYSAELATADANLGDAFGGHVDMAGAIDIAKATLEPTGDRADELRRLANALEPPELQADHLRKVIASVAGLPEKLVSVYETDIAILTERLALAQTEPGNLAASDVLDAAFAANAMIQIDAENAMLEVAISGLSPDHPQWGISSAFLASNRAGNVVFQFDDPQNPPDTEDVLGMVADLRSLADEGDAALDTTERALGKWRLQSLFNRQIRALVPLYDVSVATERQITITIRDLASSLEEQLDDDTYNPKVFTAIDARLQALVVDRIAQQQERVALIQKMSR